MVNIITKKTGDEWHGSWNTYMNAPEHKDEGSTKRTNFSLSGPLGGDFSFRLFGNLDKTQADAWDINQGHQSERTGIHADTLPAGREGVQNKNIDGLVRWEFAPMQSLEFEMATAARATSTLRRHPEHQLQRPGERELR